MPCDNRKCSLGLEKKNIDFKKLILCELQKCSKKFCNEKCLQIHFLEEHNFLTKENKKCFNYNDLNPTQKKLLKKTIEQSICGNYLEETLTCHKKRIASELNDIANSKNLQIKFDQIENDYKNLEYFCYFHYKNFDNPHTPNANFSSTSSSSLNKTGNFGNSNSNTNNETNINSNTSNNNNYNFNCSNKNNNFITPSNNTNPPNNNLTNNNNNNNNLSINNKNSQPKQFTKIIGSGAFGDVYLVKNIMDGKLFAIKQLSREKVKENGIDTELVYREINTHFKLIHNNIARLFDYYEDKKAYYLIMEYVDNGTLFNKIQKVNGLPEEKALKYFVQVSSAIFFLHENQFIHRDIKPENCLIDKNDNVKLCDFGWTVEISKGERITFCGTYEYMAPEIIKEVPYNHMIDVWSLGVLLYELIHSFSPFRAKQNKNNPLKYDPNNQIMNNIIKNKFEFEKEMSNECKDLIARILNPQFESRLNLKDIFTHPYLMNYFITNMTSKVTKMFDVLESALITKKLIFIKFYNSGKKKSPAKAENSTLFEDMEISINKSFRTKNSCAEINTFSESCHSKGEFEKNIEYKILNLKKNYFFLKIKTEFLRKLKNAAKPLNDKDTLLTNLNSILLDINTLPIKNKSIVNDYEENIKNKTCNLENFENNKILITAKNAYIRSNNNSKSNEEILSKSDINNITNQNFLCPQKAILVNKNSEFLEEVLDKIQYKRSADHHSLDIENYNSAIKKDLLNKSKNNNNNLKRKKSSKRNINNLISETQQILNSALNNIKNDLNNSKNSNINMILNELSKSTEKIGKQVFFASEGNNRSFNNEQNNLMVSNNGSFRIISEKAKEDENKNLNNNNDNNDKYNRCSSIKELNNISNSSYSLMKEIKDINTAIEHKNKKIENFIETKNNIKQVLEEKLISNSNNNNNINNLNNYEDAYNNSVQFRKASEIKDFNINDLNLNLSKMSDLRICKNINLSLFENSLLSSIKRDSPDFTHNFSNKNILNNLNNFNSNNNHNNNDIIIISSSRNQNGKSGLENNYENNYNLINKSLNNFAISDKSLLKISHRENNESQNFWFAINNSSLDKADETTRNNNTNCYNNEKSKLMTSSDNNDEQNSVSSCESINTNEEAKKFKNQNQTLLNISENINYSKLNNSKANESLLAAEKVKEFSLLSIRENKRQINKHKSQKSINGIIINFDSGCNTKNDESANNFKSTKKNYKHSKYSDNNYDNSNNNYLINNEKKYLKEKSRVNKNSSKITNQLTNSSNGNGSWDLKNNIMKIRKNNRKKKDSSRLIKIKDFEEILVDHNNKSFEEKTENCSMWKNFFGFFNVFKCGGGKNAN